MLNIIVHAFDRMRDRRVVQKALADPFFPATFLIRNVVALHQEPSWNQYPSRLKQAKLLKIVLERSSFFLQVKEWLEAQHDLPTTKTAGPAGSEKPPCEVDYCNHCGECCEIASGLAEFPPGAKIPTDWQTVFATGLGKHHRFCPFLWEAARSESSICAIHSWRPLPCRTFEREECDYLRQHPGGIAFNNDSELLISFQRLLRMLSS